MEPKRSEFLTWEEVDALIDHLLPQFQGEYDGMVMITRGGIIPGGMLAEAMGLTHILTAAVDFPAQMEMQKAGLFAWPNYLQFPEVELLRGRRLLVIDDVWGSGRTITSVKNRIASAGGVASTAVLHYNPYRSLFGNVRPDYFAAITDAHIIYPWEIDRGADFALMDGTPHPSS